MSPRSGTGTRILKVLVSIVLFRLGAPTLIAQYRSGSSAVASQRPRAEAPNQYEDADGYAVLRAFVTREFKNFKSSDRQIAIQEEAGASSLEDPPPMPDRCLASLRSEFAEAIADYVRLNAAGWLLRPFFADLPVRFSLVPASNLLHAWGPCGTNVPCTDTRQHEYTIVSVVGLDSKRRRAILSASQHYRFGGNQQYFLFRKTGATWRLAKTCVSMIAE